MTESYDDLKERCVVVSPRHAFIRPWIRAYFASGNRIPLVIIPGPPGDWQGDDMAYCAAAAKSCGGIVFDCSEEWRDSRRLSSRAVINNVGWFTKKSILYAVAKRLAPRSWAWIDDDAEVTGNLDECFERAVQSPGFVYTQFYYPDSVDRRHPVRAFRSNIDPADKICWNSFMFFHGDANARISEELNRDFPVEDDEIIFGDLYRTRPLWHEGFCDFSIHGWQKCCKSLASIPDKWNGKILHYTSRRNGYEVKKMWAGKASVLPPAPFELDECRSDPSGDEVVDAVFVIGTGSKHGDEELRYALRNLSEHCPFVRDVYICGYCPPWVDRRAVRHLQWPDRFSHAKDANIIDKLRHACEHPGIARRILFCSDDQFQTRVCSWDDFAPRYLRRYASGDAWYDKRKRVWHTRLRNTLEREVQRRIALGMDANDVFYYQPHIWMPIDREKFISYARWCRYEERNDTIIASGYFNYANVEGKPDFDHVFVAKELTEPIKATHVAYHDGSYGSIMRLLQKMFPNPCRFEIGYPAARSSSANLSVSSGKKDGGSTRAGSVAGDYDPSPADARELSDIRLVSSKVRENPVWNNLLGEVSRAEEIRLFGVPGWRVVWMDIVRRWRSATDGGRVSAAVTSARSDAASSVLSSYANDPNAIRTVRFGPGAADAVGSARRRMPALGPASTTDREELRERVRTALYR